MHMSLDEARKIIGDDAPGMTDEELDQTIYDLEMIASMTLRAITSEKFHLIDEEDA